MAFTKGDQVVSKLGRILKALGKSEAEIEAIAKAAKSVPLDESELAMKDLSFIRKNKDKVVDAEAAHTKYVDAVESKFLKKADVNRQELDKLMADRVKANANMDQGSFKHVYIPPDDNRVLKMFNSKEPDPIGAALHEMGIHNELSKEGLDPKSRAYVTSKRPYIIQDKVETEDLMYENDDDIIDMMKSLHKDLKKSSVVPKDVVPNNMGVYEQEGSPVIHDAGLFKMKDPSLYKEALPKIKSIDKDLIRQYLEKMGKGE